MSSAGDPPALEPDEDDHERRRRRRAEDAPPPAPDLEGPRRRRPDHVSGADGISTR